jgi:hypothetical protein
MRATAQGSILGVLIMTLVHHPPTLERAWILYVDRSITMRISCRYRKAGMHLVSQWQASWELLKKRQGRCAHIEGIGLDGRSRRERGLEKIDGCYCVILAALARRSADLGLVTARLTMISVGRTAFP